VQDLWTDYSLSVGSQGRNTADLLEDGQDVEIEEEDPNADVKQTDVGDRSHPRPAAISRLLNHAQSTSSSSNNSANNSSPSIATPASSKSSLASPTPPQREESHPLFVTWNICSSRHSRDWDLRGCIGTFDPHPLTSGLSSYALTSAFDDTRFAPISASELPKLQCAVTLLTNFSAPDRDPLNFDLHRHGIRVSFVHERRAYGATYLPHVAAEQGWSKEQTVVELMRKAGWRGKRGEWRSVER